MEKAVKIVSLGLLLSALFVQSMEVPVAKESSTPVGFIEDLLQSQVATKQIVTQLQAQQFEQTDLESLFAQSAKAGKSRTLRVLLEAGIDVDTREVDTNIPALHWAVYNGHQDVVGLLVEYHANTKEQINDEWKKLLSPWPVGLHVPPPLLGMTLEDVATKRGYTAIAELLCQPVAQKKPADLG